MIRIGMRLGYCSGYFGSLSFEEKIVEAIGWDWIVARGCDSRLPVMAWFQDADEMNEIIENDMKEHK